MPHSRILSPALLADLETRNLMLVRGTDLENFLDLSDGVSVSSWPEFMMHDEVANKNWRAMHKKFPGFQFALVEKESETWIAVGNSIPVHFTGELESLPDTGWDWAVLSGMESTNDPNLSCALAIQILPEYRGSGLSSIMIQIMKALGQNFGLRQLIAPVRPNKKSDYPLIPMDAYIGWSKAGQLFDPWLRVHQRLGARILKVCPEAMQIYGKVSEWESWTSLSFQSSGSYVIPGALNPIEISVERDRGVYVEPNVWMLHT